MPTNYPPSQQISDSRQQTLRDEMAAAKSLSLNGFLTDQELLNIVTNGATPAIQAASEQFTAGGQRYWYKLAPNLDPPEEFEFRTLFVRPSLAVAEEVVVRVFALKADGSFLITQGGPIGSSVAHRPTGAPGSSVAHGGISRRSFYGIAALPVYFFRVMLPEANTPPANPFRLLLYRVA
jgi:hypothetical protein